MLRGGGWNNNARNCRSANRNRNTADNRNNNNGFRLVLPPAHRASGRRPLTRAKSRPRIRGAKRKAAPMLVANREGFGAATRKHVETIRQRDLIKVLF